VKQQLVENKTLILCVLYKVPGDISTLGLARYIKAEVERRS